MSVVPPTKTMTVITQGIPQSVKGLEQRAMTAARQWHNDAYLIDADAHIPASRPDGTFTIQSRVSFSFMSRADTQHWYAVGFDSMGTLDVFEFSGRATSSEVHPIASGDWQLDSIDAWRIALANEGQALLEKYEQQTVDMRCSVNLERWYPAYTGQVVWRVMCFDIVTLKSFDFWIDAQTGAIVENEAK